jgi:hypothetical protein
MSTHVVESESGPGRHLHRHRIRLVLWIAVLEGIVVAFSHDLTKWAVLAVAVVALLLWFIGRNNSSNTLRQGLWIFATSQLLALVLVFLAVMLKWALIGGLIVIAIAGVAFLFVDRR